LENELNINKNIFETIKKYLTQLLIEYPETIYLNKIKKMLNIGQEDNEKNEN
jgi:hypothetical protein